MQPGSPMAIPDNDQANDDIMPEHLPVQMALAPEQRPYDHTHTIPREDLMTQEEKDRRKLASHSLSPEQLGVVGYVKDVAGFVKDAVKEARDKRAVQQRRRSSEPAAAVAPASPSQRSSTEAPPSPAATPSQQQQQQQQSPSALAEAVTGLFPGLDPHAHGCSHADELRHELMQSNSRESSHDPSNRFMLGDQ